MATRQEIEQLKRQWKKDPIWDIEHTDGFSEHFDELKAFREQIEAENEQRAQERFEKWAAERGLSDNLPLARHLQSLEFKIQRLEDDFGY